MMLLLIALIAYTYAEQFDMDIWHATYQYSCEEYCVNYNLGHCDQYQFAAVDTPEKYETLLRENMHPAYQCAEFEKGNYVGYVGITGWLQFKCYYFDSNLNVEDTIELCQGYKRVSKICPCTTHSHPFQSYSPTSEPTSSPTISQMPTYSPTASPTTPEMLLLHSQTQTILIVLSIATVFIVSGCCFYRYIRNRKTLIETQANQPEQSTQKIHGHNERSLEVVVPVVSEIPVVRAYVIPEYQQPSAPPKIDIEMGIK
jgi:hypothetical protein